MTDKKTTLEAAYGEFETLPPGPPTPSQRYLAALVAIGRVVFNVPEGQNMEMDLDTLVQGVNQLAISERRLRKALKRLLDARIGGTVTDKAKAEERGAKDLRETFDAQIQAGRALQDEDEPPSGD